MNRNHSTDDAELQRALLAALRLDERLSSQPIDVSVREGRVTLTGEVHSFRRKVVAQEVASGVAGSASIDNQLDVRPAENLDDAEVAEAVRSLIEGDDRLIAASVVIEVRSGRVTLSGTVAKEAERALAEDVALQAVGVHEVRNHLVIEPGARSEALVVGRELEHVLAGDRELGGCELRIAISGNVAVLSGTVSSPVQLERAVVLVREVWAGELREEVVVES